MLRVRTVLACVLLLAPVLATVPVTAEGPTTFPAPEHGSVASFDGKRIHFTVFAPADDDAPAPVVLHSHGWSGSRAKETTEVIAALREKGFGVVSVDARGHGESEGEATIHHKDAEVRDFLAVLDAVGAMPWVLADPDPCPAELRSGPDVVAGAIGGSYGGAYQLMTASYDCRLDSLAPEITWNDLTYSLAPHGAPKSDWLHVLYAAGKARARLDPRIDAWYAEVMATNEVPELAAAHLRGSNPAPERIDADVLLIQGVPDQLFNLNEALRNKAALEGGVAGDVRLFTHLGGHIASAALVDSRLPRVGPQPIGVGVERLTSPCGDVDDLLVEWFGTTLLGEPSTMAIADVAYAMEDGSCVSSFTELPPTVVAAALLPASTGAGTAFLPLLEGPALVAGVPAVSGSVSALGDARLYFSLVAVGADGSERVVDDQSTGFHVEACGFACLPGFEGELGGVATRLGAGDRLLLRVDGLNEWFATNGDRTPGPVVLSDLVVTVPRIAEV